jgi:hypothetical protein
MLFRVDDGMDGVSVRKESSSQLSLERLPCLVPLASLVIYPAYR